MPFAFVFDDLNPCSGEVHTVTITDTSWVHEHKGKTIFRSERTITTRTGFEGRGTDLFVDNGQVMRFVRNDMLTHESGERIKAHFGLVVDLSTGTVLATIGGPAKSIGPWAGSMIDNEPSHPEVVPLRGGPVSSTLLTHLVRIIRQRRLRQRFPCPKSRWTLTFPWQCELSWTSIFSKFSKNLLVHHESPNAETQDAMGIGQSQLS